MLDSDTEDGCVWDSTCMSRVLARHAGRVTFLNITAQLHGMKNAKPEGDQTFVWNVWYFVGSAEHFQSDCIFIVLRPTLYSGVLPDSQFDSHTIE